MESSHQPQQVPLSLRVGRAYRLFSGQKDTDSGPVILEDVQFVNGTPGVEEARIQLIFSKPQVAEIVVTQHRVGNEPYQVSRIFASEEDPPDISREDLDHSETTNGISEDILDPQRDL